jgi:G3E family GTPase
MHQDPSGRIPVTVLTGYLGAGKTTLLNRILQEKHGQRIAVIENEFGEIGIDNELVVRSDEEIFEMNNGCICCTVRGDLIRILGKLMRRRDKFDYILIETTGLADPSPVAQTFFVDPEIKARLMIDGIVTVVDAKHVWLHWDDSPECRDQIAFADVIILNKSDLVTPAEMDRLEKRIRSVNAVARIHRAQNADVPVDLLLNVRAFSLDQKVEINPHFLPSSDASPAPGDHAHHDHEHDESVTSVGLQESGELDLKKVDVWLGTLLKEKGLDIFRMKGILNIHNQPKRFVFQGIHMLFEGKAGEPWGDRPRQNQLVFIGRNLNRKELTEGLLACKA